MREWKWSVVVCVCACMLAGAGGQGASPTICEDEACQCDPFTRVICNCSKEYKEVTLRPDGAYRVPSTATAIIIDGCSRVTFLSETIRNLIQLRNIEVRNVRYVNINERSMAWTPFSRDTDLNPGIKILLHNSTINEIASHAIQGRVNDVIISQCSINNIKPFALSSLYGVKNVEFNDNIFQNIDIQALKKFTTSNFLLRGGAIRNLPSRFLSDVEITNLFRMDGVVVHYISSLSFLASSPKRVLIENNRIQILEGDAFHISTRGPITFRNNTVTFVRKGAFFGLTVEKETSSVTGLQELLLDNNTFKEVTPSSLMFNRMTLSLRVDGLNLNQTCTCELAAEWRSILKELGGAINCWYSLEEHSVSLPTFVDSRCGAFKRTFWIFIVIGVIVVVVTAAVIVFFVVKRENEKKKKLQIVLPDGKTYRETEFHIVVERAELLTTDL